MASLLTSIDSIIQKFDTSATPASIAYHDDHLQEDCKTQPQTSSDIETTQSDHHHLSISCKQTQLPGWSFSFDVANILYSKRSQLQDIKVLESNIFKRVLLIDGQIQSSTRDEFIYHEALTHPAMTCHPHPQNVFIGGGGEGATAREVLKHSSVQQLVSCDIDNSVIEVSKAYLPSMFAACTDDARMKLHIGDAAKFMYEYRGPAFDVIIMDIVDPSDAGPGIVCYFREFFECCKRNLSSNGVLVVQSTACSLLLYHECFTVIVNTLKNVFPDVVPYTAYVPSFYAQWGFTMAFKQAQPKWFKNAAEIDRRLDRKLGGTNGAETLRFYDGETHMQMVHLPKFLRKAIEKETRVMSKKTPYYQY